MRKTFVLLFGLAFIQSLSYPAQTIQPEKKRYTAAPVNPQVLQIDGRLDDPEWEDVKWESGFIQSEPDEGKEPSENTAFKILYDDKNLYVAIKAFDSQPEKIERRVSRRDDLDGDMVGIDIDSYFDHRTAFSFFVNAAGVKGEEFISENGNSYDSDWDPIWHAKTGVDKDGWTAEMRIPFSQLRFSNKEDHVWGLQISRRLFRKGERSHWQRIPKDSGGWVHMFGELHGLKGIRPPRQIEILPYTLGRIQQFRREPGNPFASGSLKNLMGGLDGKIGVTSDLTLNFTINPDFGQVEADPSVVNLTAFETYYQEKRPFFIEGRNIINFQITGGNGDFSSDNLFYSRRIGRHPQYSPEISDHEFIDIPGNTSIIGAFKLSGKTKSGLSIGILDSVTGDEKAMIGVEGENRRVSVEPLTNYFGLRLQKDYRDGNTIIGSMFTATNRNLKSSELQFLHDAAYSGGFDFYHSWKKKTYYFSLKTLFSRVQGTAEAILRTQESSVRYFQRPDAGYLSFDPLRTSLSGHGGTIEAGKSGSGHLQASTGVTWRSPGLELNDMGYLRGADKIMQWIWAGYQIWNPVSIFRSVNFGLNQWQGWDFGGNKIFAGGNVYFNGQLKNYWSVNLGLNRQGQSLSPGSLRGGPSLLRPSGWNLWHNLQSDNRKKVQFMIGGGIYQSEGKVSRAQNIYFGFTIRPEKGLSLTVQPSFSLNGEELQYVCTEDFGQDKRYLFGRIDQETLALTLRLNYSLTPELSIQLYGQPFVSSGKYTDFKIITDPRAKAYRNRFRIFTTDEITYDNEQEQFSIDEDRNGTTDYTIDDPNFHFLEFRANLVIRWEYIPGSSLYVVWSQGRTGVSCLSDSSFQEGMRGLFDIHPLNVFLIKFSYCFQL